MTRSRLNETLAKLSGEDLDAIGTITGVTRYPWNSTSKMGDEWYRARIAQVAVERRAVES